MYDLRLVTQALRAPRGLSWLTVLVFLCSSYCLLGLQTVLKLHPLFGCRCLYLPESAAGWSLSGQHAPIFLSLSSQSRWYFSQNLFKFSDLHSNKMKLFILEENQLKVLILYCVHFRFDFVCLTDTLVMTFQDWPQIHHA